MLLGPEMFCTAAHVWRSLLCTLGRDPFEATESLCCNTHGTHDVQDMQDMHSTFTRRLHQNEQGSAGSGASEQVLAVFTPVELQQAIEDGVTHIEIQQHMALSTLPLRGLRNSELTAVLGGVPSSVLSIQVRSQPCLPETECLSRQHKGI